MKTLILLLSIFLLSCEKQEPFEMPIEDYQIMRVEITAIVVNPDTLLGNSKKYLNIMIQHSVDNNWCDLKTEQRPVIEWSGHNARFNIELTEKDMAIEIKPSTCPGTILGLRIKLNDSIVMFQGESEFIRIKVNN